MDTLKPFEQVTQPDERWRNFVRLNETSGTFQPHSLEDRYGDINGIQLSASVPESIRVHFETARNLLLYAWFVYRFTTVSELHAYATIEMALRERARQADLRTKGLSNLLKKAIQLGWIVDDGFALVRRSREAAAREREIWEAIGAPITREELDAQHYCKILLEVLPKLRNELAHGSHIVHVGGFSTLALCADLINQLFPEVPSS